jgi:hypothetical protein
MNYLDGRAKRRSFALSSGRAIGRKDEHASKPFSAARECVNNSRPRGLGEVGCFAARDFGHRAVD